MHACSRMAEIKRSQLGSLDLAEDDEDDEDDAKTQSTPLFLVMHLGRYLNKLGSYRCLATVKRWFELCSCTYIHMLAPDLGIMRFVVERNPTYCIAFIP